MSSAGAPGFTAVVEMATASAPQLERVYAPETRRVPWEWLTFLSPRSSGFGAPEGVALLVYGMLLAWVIPHHEAWFDEAQAWLIARDSSLFDLVVHRLHYEGSPALWHLLLWVEARLGLSFLGMHLFTGAVAVVGVYVWLRYSPLPRFVNILMPFTYYVIFQYAVVARSYVLAPLLIFSLMAMYANRRITPWFFALLAGLLANCSLHAASIAVGFAFVYGVDRLKHSSASRRWRLAGPAVLLAGFFVASAATAMPTIDGSSTTANPLVQSVRRLASGHGRNTVASPVKSAQDELAVEAPTTAPEQGRMATRVWWAIRGGSNQGRHGLMDGRVLKHGLVLLTAVTASLSTSNALAFIFLVLLCMNLALARMWLALLPYVFLQLCNVLVAGEAHHIGLTWITLMAVLWMLALRTPKGELAVGMRIALYACLIVVEVLQVGWGAHALAADVKGPYSSAPATAAYLQTLPVSTRIAAFDDDSVTVNAYLRQRPYFNQKVNYWPFSRTTNPSLFVEQTMNEQPDMVIVKMAQSISPVMDQWVKLVPTGTEFVEQDMVQMLQARGYRETHRFCGSRFYRNTSESLDCRLVYERSPDTGSAH